MTTLILDKDHQRYGASLDQDRFRIYVPPHWLNGKTDTIPIDQIRGIHTSYTKIADFENLEPSRKFDPHHHAYLLCAPNTEFVFAQDAPGIVYLGRIVTCREDMSKQESQRIDEENKQNNNEFRALFQ